MSSLFHAASAATMAHYRQQSQQRLYDRETPIRTRADDFLDWKEEISITGALPLEVLDTVLGELADGDPLVAQRILNELLWVAFETAADE